MISSTMTPKQMASAMNRLKRALDDPPQPPAKRRRVRRRKQSNGGSITTNARRSAQAIETRGYVLNKTNPSDIITLRNHEIANFDVLPTGASPYTRIFTNYIYPGNTASAAAVSLNYSKYRYRKLIIHYTPNVGTLQDGLIAMGFFTDPEDGNKWLTGGVSATTLARLSASRRFTYGPLYAPLSIEVDPSDFVYDWYVLDPDSPTDASEARLSRIGSLGLWVQGNASLGTASPGTISLEYVIECKDMVAVAAQT